MNQREIANLAMKRASEYMHSIQVGADCEVTFADLSFYQIYDTISAHVSLGQGRKLEIRVTLPKGVQDEKSS